MEATRGLTPAYLASLRGLKLKSDALLAGALAGQHRSPFQGYSAEFSQFRGYVAGDDLRYLDWKVYARSGHPVIRQYRDETNTTLYLVVDTSASMGFKGGLEFSKLQSASMLAGALATVGFRQRDAISLLAGGNNLTQELPPHAGHAHYREVMERLENLEPAGQTDLAKLLAKSALRLKSKSMGFVFTDLWQPIDSLLLGLRQIKAKLPLVTVVHLTTKDEQTLLGEGEVLLRDLETEQNLLIDRTTLRADYVRLRRSHQDQARAGCLALGTRFLSLDVGQPLDLSLRRLIFGEFKV